MTEFKTPHRLGKQYDELQPRFSVCRIVGLNRRLLDEPELDRIPCRVKDSARPEMCMKVQCYECGLYCECSIDPDLITDSWTCPTCVQGWLESESDEDEDDLVESACCMANPDYRSTSYRR